MRIAVVTGLTACTSEPRESVCPTPEPELPRVAMVPQLRPLAEEVIVTLRTRDHEITVYTSEHGVRFWVQGAEGQAIVTRTLDQAAFAHGFPELHRQFERAVADGDMDLWAGL